MRRIRFLIGIIGLCGIVATALGQPNSSAGVLAKKVEHYQTKGYSVIKAGDFPPAGINNSANYVVVSHPYHNVLRVPALKTVTLEPGTRLFIEPGIKMQVDGHLNAAYAGFSGVVASDLYLGQMIANKNWRGIGVAETGSLNFKGVTIQDADSAINSIASANSLHIECLKIAEKQDCAVKIQGVCIPVEDPTCFTFEKKYVDLRRFNTKAQPDSNNSIVLPPLSSAQQITLIKPDLKPTQIWGITTGALLCGTIAAGIITKIYFDKSNNGTNLNQVNADGDIANSSFLALQITGAATGIALIGTTISFTITKTKETNH